MADYRKLNGAPTHRRPPSQSECLWRELWQNYPGQARRSEERIEVSVRFSPLSKSLNGLADRLAQDLKGHS
jgi:hypothetical protein